MYITSKLSIQTISEQELENYISEICENFSDFPVAVIKTSKNIEIAMDYNECITKVNSLLEIHEDFQLQEYIKPDIDKELKTLNALNLYSTDNTSNNLSLKIIRVYLEGSNVFARVLENQTLYDSEAPNEEKYLLNKYNKSQKAVLSFSNIELKNQAVAVRNMISSAVGRNYVISNVSLDFIHQDNVWYLITVHSYKTFKVLKSLSKTSSKPTPKQTIIQSPTLFSLSEKKEKIVNSYTQRNNLVLPEPYTTERNLDHRLNILIEKSQTPALKHVSYKKWSVNTDEKDFLYTLYSKKIQSNKDIVLKSHSKGIGTLKNMASNMEDAIKTIQKKFLYADVIKIETGKFLMERIRSSRIENDGKVRKMIDDLKPSSNYKLEYATKQIDKMKKNSKKNK